MSHIPDDIAIAADYLSHAERALDPKIWAWLAGASGDGSAKRANRSAFEKIHIYNRICRSLGDGHTRLKLFDQPFQHPVLLAPIGFQRLLHPQGEASVAQGAEAADACAVLSTLSSVDLETVASAAPGRRWFQLYLQPRQSDTLTLIRRAEAAGYSAIIVTLDTPIQPLASDARRAGFQMPAGILAAKLEGFSPPPQRALNPGDSVIFQGAMQDAPHWADLEWLAGETNLPVLAKGVSHPDDAALCLEHGARGVIVSTHGGRALDTLPGTLSLLPSIRKRLGPDATILMDGGIQSGADIFKAIALGADAVLVGRLYAAALATAGALGVAHAIKLLREEFELTMALAGCGSLFDIGPDCLVSLSEDYT